MDEAIAAAARRKHKRRAIWAFSVLGAALAVVLVLLAAAVPFSSDTLRDRIVSTLSDRLDADVAMDGVTLRLFPRVHVVGTGLVVRQRDRENVPPLISIRRFEVDADLTGLLRKRVAHVELEGLDIEIPPGKHQDAPADERPDGAAATIGVIGADDKETDDPAMVEGLEEGVVIERLDTKSARLAIISSKSSKPAKVWDIHTLHMEGVGAGRSMPFQATLTNGIPKGEIETAGHFGPWQRDEPGDTPLDGSYTFENADLSVFKGISGMLASTGSFTGTLDRIEAQGETDTPDFTIRLSGHPFPLHTSFHSIIDGTNGDTILERIDATFLESSLVARGAVVDDSPGVDGRTVTLDIDMEKARIEDILTMSVKAERPPMTGGLQLQTKFVLPPGEKDVPDRLQLDGAFAIESVKFNDYDVQGKIEELSKRGRGVKKGAAGRGVVSNFAGKFKLGDGRLALPALSFSVPGAVVQLAGTYALEPERLNFKGQLLLDAKISETTTGFKSLLLKLVDPFFKQKDGSGSAIPIKLSGRRDAPEFGVDMGRAFKKD
jgi:hypothetical protein